MKTAINATIPADNFSSKINVLHIAWGIEVRTYLSVFLLLFAAFAHADVVRPALIEISVDVNQTVTVDIRTSIEAVMTGINGRWKNTQDAPPELAEAYDALRVLPADELRERFRDFQTRFERGIQLRVDQRNIELNIAEVSIPEPGYTKVPRNSVIVLQGRLPTRASELVWHYPQEFGDNAVRVRQVNEQAQQWHWSQWQWIRDGSASQPFDLTFVYGQRELSFFSVLVEYLPIGFDHIIPLGLDHVLFVLGLFLFSARLKPLISQVTMFTVAHSLTLALSVFGWVSLPANIVEPLIALSIAYVAIENIWGGALKTHRMALVFGFGLLHGLGFASVLTEFGMPQEDFVAALIGFNVGVELGQLAVILLAFLTVGLWFAHRDWYRRVIIVPASLAIAVTALYWTYDRIQIS